MKTKALLILSIVSTIEGDPSPKSSFSGSLSNLWELYPLQCAFLRPVWLYFETFCLCPSIHSLLSHFWILVTNVVLSVSLKSMTAPHMPQIMGIFLSVPGFYYSSSICVTVNDQTLLQSLLLISRLLAAWMSVPLSKKYCNDRAPLSPFCWWHWGHTCLSWRPFCLPIRDGLHSLLQIAQFSHVFFFFFFCSTNYKWLSSVPESSAMFFCSFVLFL